MIHCLNCKTPLPASAWNNPEPSACLQCGYENHAHVFPAFYEKPKALKSGPSRVEENTAACFYHPRKKAVFPCNTCGRFLCDLCHIEINDDHICPLCLEKGSQTGRIENLEKGRLRYDNIALGLAIFPLLLLFFITFITAPAAIYLSVRWWERTTAVAGRPKIRFTLAICIAVFQLVGWGFFAVHWLA